MMYCLEKYEQTYEGKFTIMGKSKEQKDKIKNIQKKKIIEISVGGAISIILAATGSVVAATWLICSEIGKIKTDIALLNESVNNLSDIDTELSEISKYLYNDGGVQTQLTNINNVLDIVPISTTLNPNFGFDDRSIERNDLNLTKSSIQSNTYIGTDINGHIYIADELINETIFLTYTENDKEVYFLGQYNENYHWDKYCITNAYNSDGTLFGICESNFDDGKRLDYTSFYNSTKENEWIYVSKDLSGEEGTSIKYNLENKNIKNFTSTNARITDIICIDQLAETLQPQKLTYYHGKISNGTYNDKTGNAYEIIYDDEIVKTLYVGNFENGTFKDNNAWEISYSENGEFYVYNTGVFEKGHAINGSNTPINTKEINVILEDNHFSCNQELNWKQTKYDKE